MNRSFPFTVVCFYCLFVFSLPIHGQEKKAPSLQDAKTRDDISAYLMHKFPPGTSAVENPNESADVWFAAGDKLSEIAKDEWEKQYAYHLKIQGFFVLLSGQVEGAEQKLEAYLDELTAGGHKESAEKGRFQLFTEKARQKEKSPENYATFLSELKKWIDRKIRFDDIMRSGNDIAQKHEVPAEQFLKELLEYIRSAECTLPSAEKSRAATDIGYSIEQHQFYQFMERAMKAESTPENFAAFKSELKSWVDRARRGNTVDAIGSLGLQMAQKNGVPAEEFIKELVEYIRSTSPSNEHRITRFETMLRLAYGSDPKLFGRTLDDKNFDWKSLRGKYVLIQFTATWCGPCKMEIPGMLEAYKKYRDKGFEIVSVYIWERGDDPVATVKKNVEQEGLPWIIISETLTEKSGQPKQGDFYVTGGVPTMVLVDKEGKIVMMEARSDALKKKLAEIFE
jgi:thiol-disulfide isomerase/thioredoxin